MEDDIPPPVKRHHQISEPELRVTIAGLYDDELEPLGRLVRRRLLDTIASPLGLDCRDALEIDPDTLRSACEGAAGVVVVALPQNEYAALLRNRAHCFVDVNSNVDPYPNEFWRRVSDYLAGVADTISLPCDRYECAKVLHVSGPPFLAKRTLGEVCHIVSLAIGPRRLLQRVDANIVPVISRQGLYSMTPGAALPAKRGSEDTSRPSIRRSGQMHTATLHDVRAHLLEMLDTSTCPAAGAMYLSQVQALFRDRHHLQLSATALGHDRLEAVFQSADFEDLCEVTVWGDEVLLELKSTSASILECSQLSRPSSVVAHSWGGVRALPNAPAGERAVGRRQALDPRARHWQPSPGHLTAGAYGLHDPSAWALMQMLPVGLHGVRHRARPQHHIGGGPMLAHYHWPLGGSASEYTDCNYSSYNDGWGMAA